MNTPRITLVTPSFNQGRFLDQTIRSVLDQGYANLEYMVVDGGSADESVEIIRKHADRLAWWVSEKDRGQSHAINKGFERATGDIYAYINSDDFLYPGALQAVADAWNKGARWMTGWVMRLEADGGEWPELPDGVYADGSWFARNPVPQQGSFWAGDYWKSLGAFREDFRYVFDYEYWMRLRFRGQVRPTVVSRCLGSYRMHASSKTVSEWDLFEPEFERVRGEYLPLLPRRQQRKMLRAKAQFDSARRQKEAWQALKRDDLPAARKAAKAAIGDTFFSADAWKAMYFALRGKVQ